MSAPRDPVWVDVGVPPGTDVWHIVLDVARETVDPFTALLDAGELRRARRLRDEQAAHRFVAAHGAVRSVLGSYLDVAGYTLHWARGPNGKPYFDGEWRRWQWSLSRSGGHALLAVRLHDPVGVDIEQIRDDVQANALSARFMPPEEAAEVAGQPDDAARNAAYHRLLSRKESCVKASGGRLLDGLRLGVLVPGTVEGTGAFAGQRWSLRDLPAPPGFVATLATIGDRPPRLRMFEWDWHTYPYGGHTEAPTGRPPERPEATPPPGDEDSSPPHVARRAA
ncbi:4'-phosphopantetheinyl transferase superfamily protein [Micromonospora sp. NPDC047134]|uniref:4'-phosphopantetheinyl transferase family protein n=1 Tax=Micromonospora sp. NPDC047134 TaxID=3154340 RepID=UPI0033FFD301